MRYQILQQCVQPADTLGALRSAWLLPLINARPKNHGTTHVRRALFPPLHHRQGSAVQMLPRLCLKFSHPQSGSLALHLQAFLHSLLSPLIALACLQLGPRVPFGIA